LGPMRFALGAAMMLRREKLDEIHHFTALMDYLADDYELGRRVATTGARVELGTVVVECRSAPLTAREVWSHQLRWARTIRACRPWAYFFSIAGNATLWPVLWVLLRPEPLAQLAAVLCLGARMFGAYHLEKRMNGVGRIESCGMAMLKDMFQGAVWLAAFLGRGVIWRGEHYRVAAGGRLVQAEGTAAKCLAPAPPAP
jgi:ceramide glucosyltransferase